MFIFIRIKISKMKNIILFKYETNLLVVILLNSCLIIEIFFFTLKIMDINIYNNFTNFMIIV